MPLYILCPQCEAVPVTKTNELCEACQKQADAAAKRYKQKLTRQEQKPRRLDDVRKDFEK